MSDGLLVTGTATGDPVKPEHLTGNISVSSIKFSNSTYDPDL